MLAIAGNLHGKFPRGPTAPVHNETQISYMWSNDPTLSLAERYITPILQLEPHRNRTYKLLGCQIVMQRKKKLAKFSVSTKAFSAGWWGRHKSRLSNLHSNLRHLQCCHNCTHWILLRNLTKDTQIIFIRKVHPSLIPQNA
jgi:hypothetical protein